VVVVTAPVEARNWIITAYITRRLDAEFVEWKRN
jgi:hypothetical protein